MDKELDSKEVLCYTNFRLNKKALKHFNKSLPSIENQIATIKEDPVYSKDKLDDALDNLLICYHGLGTCYLNKRNWSKAEKFYTCELNYTKDLGILTRQAYTYSGLARLHALRYELLKDNGDKSIQLGLAIDNIKEAIRCFNWLNDIEKEKMSRRILDDFEKQP